jgi:hypothetical protein
VGVLQRFERRLEGLVHGSFARAFGGVVEPVEVAAALQREANDKKAIVSAGRVLVPNHYVVELGRSDSERLGAYDEPLRKELADMLAEHAQEQGWSFVGQVVVHFELVEELKTGVFRVRSSAAGDVGGPAALRSPPASSAPQLAAPDLGAARAAPALQNPDDPSAPDAPGAAADPGQVAPDSAASQGDDSPHLMLAPPVGGPSGPHRRIELDGPVLVLGRGLEADLQLADVGVSRRHAEVRLGADGASVVDLGSTNGTRVNGRRVASSPLRDGDHIGLGATDIVFRTGR